MKYYCIDCGVLLASISQRPNFCQECQAPQNSEAAAKLKNKAKLKPQKVEPEPEEEEEDYETAASLPETLNIQVDLGGWKREPMNLGSVINTSREGRGGFKRPANEKYIETVQKKFKSTEPIDISL